MRQVGDATKEAVKAAGGDLAFSSLEALRSIVATGAAAIGLTYAVSEIIGAVAFAVFGAAIARRADAEAAAGSGWITFSAAATAAALAIVALLILEDLGLSVTPAIVTFGIGFVSRPLVRRLHQRSDQIVDAGLGKVLPGMKEEDDEGKQ